MSHKIELGLPPSPVRECGLRTALQKHLARRPQRVAASIFALGTAS